MANNLYVTPTEARSGKSAIVLGLMEALIRTTGTVGLFRPIINTPDRTREDRDIRLIRNHYQLDIPYEETYAFTFQEARELINLGRQEVLLEGVLNQYKKLESQFDFVLCEGTDFETVTSAFEFDINLDIAYNLGSPLLIVTNGRHKSADDIIDSTNFALESFEAKDAHILAVIVNRAVPELVDEIGSRLRDKLRDTPYLGHVIPEEPTLGKPTVREIAKILEAEVLFGEDHMEHHVYQYTIAAMQLRHYLQRVEDGSLVISPGDRGDIILGSLASRLAATYPNIAGILLTGGLRLDPTVAELIKGWSEIPAPILLVQDDTFSVARRLSTLYTEIDPEDDRKIATVMRLFEAHVDADRLCQRLTTSRPRALTPKMFEYGLIQKAKARKQHIVLPEGVEDRILRATEIIVRRDVARITLLGDAEEIDERIRT
ncbi:MAG: phosphate acyltransferase, partial [Candidatus Competibacterales bacterium]|nr:phosphate acyltransferase [Candidatus Competibacterales bacterium]